MGQPPQWQPYASMSWLKAGSEAGAGALAGIYRPILNPITGALGGSAGTTLFIVAAEWRGMTASEMVGPTSGQVLATEVEVPGAGWP